MGVPCAAPLKLPKEEALDPNKQRTIEKPVSLSGAGLFSGEEATLTICPAGSGAGIAFERTDLPSSTPMPATLDHVVSTPRCTILGNVEYTVQTVEHLMAALAGLGIDNARLKLSGPEVPILDGSADPFVTAILEAGITESDVPKEVFKLEEPVSWSRSEVHIVAVPSDTFQVSYTLHFPQSALLRSQFFSSPITPEIFSKEIAASRTFCFYEEITPFIEQGLIKGGGLDNAVIIKNDVVVNAEGVRFTDEMVRHKILDFIGDLALLPYKVQAHFIAIRSGHASNVAFAKKLFQHIQEKK